MLVGFGSSQTGLPVGFCFLGADGITVQPRTTAGVVELGDGWYSVVTSAPTEAKFIQWDTGAPKPRVAVEELAEVALNRDGDILNLLDRILARMTMPGNNQNVAGGSNRVSERGIITIIRGDDYAAAEGRALQFAATGVDLANVSNLTLAVQKGARVLARWPCVIKRNVDTNEPFIELELSAAQTSQFELGLYSADLEAGYANKHHITLWRRPVSVVSE